MRSITRHIAVRNDLTKVQEMEDLDNTIQELLCIDHEHAHHFDLIHLSACWTSLGRLARS